MLINTEEDTIRKDGGKAREQDWHERNPQLVENKMTDDRESMNGYEPVPLYFYDEEEEVTFSFDDEGEDFFNVWEAGNRGNGFHLFEPDLAEEIHGRWLATQVEFPANPSSAIEEANELMQEVMQRLTKSFDEARARSTEKPDSADDEMLRIAMRRYASFFDRIISADL